VRQHGTRREGRGRAPVWCVTAPSRGNAHDLGLRLPSHGRCQGFNSPHFHGKEGNKLIERLTGVIIDLVDYRTDYGPRAGRWNSLVLPVLRAMGADLAERTGDVSASRRASPSSQEANGGPRVDESLLPQSSGGMG
jgi:hypothetical protein